jgi:hypothetical protein
MESFSASKKNYFLTEKLHDIVIEKVHPDTWFIVWNGTYLSLGPTEERIQMLLINQAAD